jgi:hypothetical protein
MSITGIFLGKWFTSCQQILKDKFKTFSVGRSFEALTQFDCRNVVGAKAKDINLPTWVATFIRLEQHGGSKDR